MRISRHCYNKPHRCPGWAGPGWRRENGAHICTDGGSLTRQMFPGGARSIRFMMWRSYKCPKCGTRTIPLVTRWLDPSWLKWWVNYKIQEWKEDREWRQG